MPYLGFTRVSEADSRMHDLEQFVAAVLAAEVTNVGVEPVVHDGVDALSRRHLFRVEQNYLRAQPLSRANASLVDYDMRLPPVQGWRRTGLRRRPALHHPDPHPELRAEP